MPRLEDLKRPIRIGIDGRRLGPRLKGIGRYIWELCRGLDRTLPEARFFLYAPKAVPLPQISARWSMRIDNSPLGRLLPNNFWLAARAGLMSRCDHLDAFWAGTGLLPLLGLKGRAVLTVHDIVHKVAPDTMDSRALWAARLFFSASLAKADAIVSNSIGTATRLEKSFGCKVAAIVRPGLSNVFQRSSEQQKQAVFARYQVTHPYLLSVSTWEPRKGLEPLIRAFVRMKAEGRIGNRRLLLVGDRGWKDLPIITLTRGSQEVRCLGFVDDASLAALYTGADAFIYPSTYEGFGMPVLEARACGTQIVTSNIPELREAGGNDAIYVAPTEDGIRAGICLAIERRTTSAVDWRDWNWSKSASILAGVLTDRQPCARSSGAEMTKSVSKGVGNGTAVKGLRT